MAKLYKQLFSQFGWTILLYGLGMGLLLVVLQTARYRFLILDHAQELYFGLIALLFTGLGIWAGRQLTARLAKPTKPLSGDALEQTLAKLGITPREYEVLQLIAQGLSNQEIAGRMFVSLNTIKTHTSNLFSKLDAQRRTQAVQKAQAIGLLSGTHPKV
ncbi:MAG: response regulator transcription factor [Lewinellaceae bacterium]|nr:response regulator transcription factor [Saprospiraceae bacterium]MCB9333754.1 response regulator transcription factor [Lewinellaceae bacterium]